MVLALSSLFLAIAAHLNAASTDIYNPMSAIVAKYRNKHPDIFLVHVLYNIHTLRHTYNTLREPSVERTIIVVIRTIFVGRYPVN